MNVNNAVTKAYENKSFKELVGAPVDALQGVSAGDAKLLQEAFNVKTIGDLANLKSVKWAKAITIARNYEANKEILKDRESGLRMIEYYFNTLLGQQKQPLIVESLYDEMCDEDKNYFDDLPLTLEIFRGGYISEFESNSFKQSWSLDLEVAHRFAFLNPDYSLEVVKKDRALFCAKILKSDVLAFINSDPDAFNQNEKECIVNTNKLLKVEICQRGEEFIKSNPGLIELLSGQKDY